MNNNRITNPNNNKVWEYKSRTSGSSAIDYAEVKGILNVEVIK